jgi:hypothetical protein
MTDRERMLEDQRALGDTARDIGDVRNLNVSPIALAAPVRQQASGPVEGVTAGEAVEAAVASGEVEDLDEGGDERRRAL